MKKVIHALLMLLLVASCSTQKQVPYFQDLKEKESVKIAPPQDIRLKTGDQVTIHVNSKDAELALPLNLIRLTNNNNNNSSHSY